jgi:hypothetical protein
VNVGSASQGASSHPASLKPENSSSDITILTRGEVGVNISAGEACAGAIPTRRGVRRPGGMTAGLDPTGAALRPQSSLRRWNKAPTTPSATPKPQWASRNQHVTAGPDLLTQPGNFGAGGGTRTLFSYPVRTVKTALAAKHSTVINASYL